jgi:hypothetical protein
MAGAEVVLLIGRAEPAKSEALCKILKWALSHLKIEGKSNYRYKVI